MHADDPLPPDEPLAERVTTGLAKVGIALKQQAWAEAGGRGLTPTQGQVLALLRRYSAHAVFCEVGMQVALHPQITRDVVEAREKPITLMEKAG